MVGFEHFAHKTQKQLHLKFVRAYKLGFIKYAKLLESNQNNKFSEGLKFLPLIRNKAIQEGIKYSPQKAISRMSFELSSQTFSFPNNSIKRFRLEKQFHASMQRVIAFSK